MRNLLFILCCLFSLSVVGQDDLNYDGNNDGCVNYEDVLNILTEYGQCEDASIFECGDSLLHYNDYYATVEINGRCWFQENLRYLPEVSPSSAGSETAPYYYVYDYEGTDVEDAKATPNYATYGVLYNWPAVMTEGICPSGWHIPSDGEFTELTDFLGGEGVAGGKMKDNILWDGSNTSGWTGLPGGYRYSGGFNDNGDGGYWWSASESGSDSWERSLYNFNDNVYRSGYYFRYYGFSARCVRD